MSVSEFARGRGRAAWLLWTVLALAGCGHALTAPSTRTFALSGRVRLVGTLTAESSQILGSRIIDDADGVPVELLRGTTVVARTRLAGGVFRFAGLYPASYMVRAGVLPTVASKSPILVIANKDVIASDTLVIRTVGDMWPAPNPLAAGTWIYFALADTAHAQVRILDGDGAEVRTLRAGPFDAGLNGVYWDGADGAGQPVTGRFYWATYESPAEQRTFLLFPS